MVQGKVSIYEEHYNTRIATEIIPLHHAEGTRHSVHLKPYILEPQLFLTVGLYTTPKHYADQDEVIGEVLKTEEKGMRQHEIGNAQAWYYPAERMIVVWECYLGDLRTHLLTEDTHMGKLWRSFEQ